MANARQKWVCGPCGENYDKESYAEECCSTPCLTCGHKLWGFSLIDRNCSDVYCMELSNCSCISKTDN